MPRDVRQAWAAQARMARERFLGLLDGDGPRAAQTALLAQCVAGNADTAFGRAHGFAGLRDLDAFRAAVPIRHYEELEPWIDRAAAGEPAVLTREDPIRFWKTTGTTSRAKKIPLTPSAHARVSESFLALHGTQLHFFPAVGQRADAILHPHLSPRPVKEWLGDGRFPFCSTTEVPVDARPQNAAFLAPWLIPLQDVAVDDAERLYFLLAFAALHDLLAIGCLHPSRFQTLVGALDASWPRLVRELHDGTLLGKPARAPRPERARELEKIAGERGTLRPRDVWPHLQLLTSWSGGYLGRYLPIMESAFCSPLAHLPTPSISSECFLTMTIDRDPIAQPINLRGAVFEFAPAGAKLEPHAPTLAVHELAAGESYEVIITTLAGLYRYATCDIFRVAGFAGTTPRLEYVGRRSVSDLTGEKLAEAQVADAVPAALAAVGAPAAGFTLCGVQATRPRYVLVIEPEPGGDWPRGRAEELARDLDERLKRLNSRYAMKRNFNDLDPIAVEVVAPGTFARYRARLIERGAPAGQVKDRVLHAAGAAVLEELL